MVYRSPLNQDEGDLYTGTRICRGCEKRRPMTEFYWTIKDKVRIRKCQECCGNRQRERKEERKEVYKEKGFARNLRAKYGLTVQEWQRLLESQDEKCQICKKDLTTKNTHVDHDHVTDQIRGLLCFECNTGIGKFHDNIEWLLAAVAYLQSPYPEVTLRSRDLSPEEKRQIRSESILEWHRSEEGQEVTKQRSAKFSGENNAAARLTDEQVIEIIHRYQAGGISQQALAAEYGISQTNISRIMLGKTRKSTKDPLDSFMLVQGQHFQAELPLFDTYLDTQKEGTTEA